MRHRSATALEEEITRPADAAVFSADEIAGLPEPVRRYFVAAILPETPLALSARMAIRGKVKLKNRWMPFSSHEVLTPHVGFVWTAKVGLLSGLDASTGGNGRQRWRLFGVIPVVRAAGPDVSRSSIGRFAAEGIWLPTALLPRFGVRWSAIDDHQIVATITVDGVEVEMHLQLDDHARLRSAVWNRWGDPDATGTWANYPFGIETSGYGSFEGVSIPTRGRSGWFYGTDRWSEGEFFSYEITEYELVL